MICSNCKFLKIKDNLHLDHHPRKTKEKCGVIGIHCPKNGHFISRQIYFGLISLQHRGQESAGISMKVNNHIRGYKAQGLVYNVFNDQIIKGMLGRIGIGHVRYSTTSESSIENAQPFDFRLPKSEFSLAFNGTLTNFIELQKKYSEVYTFKTSTDTEVIVYLLSKNLLETNYDYFEAIKLTMNELRGSFSIVLINSEGDLFGFRDSLGFKPLCIGRVEENDIKVIASESVALDIINAKLEREVFPGEIIRINDDGIQSIINKNNGRLASCMFEYVYFARPDSIINNITVYDVREKLGAELAKSAPVEADLVVPVPDSGRTAAVGYSLESGIPLCEGLLKNRYVHRTFILPTQEQRELSVRLKLNPIRSKIEGKNIVLIDDSIVRSTTARNIIRILRKSGVKKIHFRVSCPPIIEPCYMGIDFPNSQRLIAATHNIKEIAETIGADSLAYQTLDGLLKSIGLDKNQLCIACITGSYPFDFPNKKLLEQELSKAKD